MDSHEFSSLGKTVSQQFRVNFNSIRQRIERLIFHRFYGRENEFGRVKFSRVAKFLDQINFAREWFRGRVICDNFIRKSTSLKSIEFDELRDNFCIFLFSFQIQFLSRCYFFQSRFHFLSLSLQSFTWTRLIIVSPPFYRIFSPTPTFLQRLLFPLVSLFFLSPSRLHLFRPILLILWTSSLNIILDTNFDSQSSYILILRLARKNYLNSPFSRTTCLSKHVWKQRAIVGSKEIGERIKKNSIPLSKRKVGIGFENRRKDCEQSRARYKFKLCQFESSLPRQTAKNRHPRRDKFVDDAWNWSTVCPSPSFHSSLPLLLPSVGQISRTQRFLFLDQRESPDFSFEGKSSKMGRRDSRTPRFLREYRFFDRFLLWTRSMHRCTESMVQDRNLNY